MDIYCYKYNNTTQNLEQLGIIDDFISLSYTMTYNDIGQFQLVLDASTNNAKRTKDMNIISYGKTWLENRVGLVVTRMEELDLNNQKVIITGIELKGLAAYRLVIPPTGQSHLTYTGKSPDWLVRALIDNQLKNETGARQVKSTMYTLGQIDTPIEINYSGRYTNLAEDIIQIATTYDIGWTVIIYEGSIAWLFWRGLDYSISQNENPHLIISYGVDTVGKSVIAQTNNIPSYLLMAGQGEGVDRTIIPFDDGSVGINRVETFVDARQIDDINTLIEQGLLKYVEYGDNIVYKATFSETWLQTHAHSLYLGSIATIVDDRLPEGKINCRLVEFTEVYEGGKMRVDAKFGYDNINLTKKINRVANSVKPLLLQ